MPPDRHFVIDALPGHPRITVAVDAGHAFKFATLIGRILSELALDGRTDSPIGMFQADRPALTDPTFEPVFRNEAVLSRS
jgi:sarcosine oxidase